MFKLRVLPDNRDDNGVPQVVLSEWVESRKRFELTRVELSPGELARQLREPVRVAKAPNHWLFRGRVVLEESVSSAPDSLVDLLERIADGRFEGRPLQSRRPVFVCQECGGQSERWVGRCGDCGAWNSFIEERQVDQSDEGFALALEDQLRSEGLPFRMRRDQLREVVRLAKQGVLPLRDSKLLTVRSDEVLLRVKHAVLRQERVIEKLRQEVEAFEAFESGRMASRQPIPRAVRMFVWERDGGRCRGCGSRERLEFDHIIPVSKGGSDTERNVQLLCEACNRSKGGAI